MRGMKNPGASDGWLHNVVKLFESVCVPSFTHQTVSDFCWVLLIDASSPEWLSQALQDVLSRNNLKGTVRPITGFLIVETLGAAVSDLTSREFLLSTRVDNDDVVATDFIEYIQNSFIPEDRTILDPYIGSQMSDGKLYFEVVTFSWTSRPGGEPPYGEVQQGAA